MTSCLSKNLQATSPVMISSQSSMLLLRPSLPQHNYYHSIHLYHDKLAIVMGYDFILQSCSLLFSAFSAPHLIQATYHSFTFEEAAHTPMHMSCFINPYFKVATYF